VVDLAKSRGISGVHDVRHLKRIEGIMEVLNIVDANATWFDDPNSPIADQPYHLSQFLQLVSFPLSKYLTLMF